MDSQNCSPGYGEKRKIVGREGPCSPQQRTEKGPTWEKQDSGKRYGRNGSSGAGGEEGRETQADWWTALIRED